MATQKTIREMNYTFMQDPNVEEETLKGVPKGGGKEELGDEEWVSLNTLSLKKTKIWRDYLTP